MRTRTKSTSCRSRWRSDRRRRPGFEEARLQGFRVFEGGWPIIRALFARGGWQTVGTNRIRPSRPESPKRNPFPALMVALAGLFQHGEEPVAAPCGTQTWQQEQIGCPRPSCREGARVPHSNVVLFDVMVGFHSRLKLATFPGGLGSSVTFAECPISSLVLGGAAVHRCDNRLVLSAGFSR
jgi:hypothetical protein